MNTKNGNALQSPEKTADSCRTQRPRLSLQARDLAILEGLFECRIMQRHHATAIYFESKDAAAKRRLQMLKGNGYIAEQDTARLPSERAVYRLTHMGFQAISESGLLERYRVMCRRRFEWASLDERHRVSPRTVEHELGVMDLKAALFTALRNHPEFSIGEFWTWPLLYEFRVNDPTRREGVRAVRPDGFIRIIRRQGDRALSRLFFQEFDRGSEIHTTLVEKVEAYRQYNRSPAFAQFLTGSDQGEFGFRVLVVFKTSGSRSAQERLFNHAHCLSRLDPPVRTLVWLTTHAEFVANPVGRIWICPVDYAQALVGTPYDPGVVDWTPRGRETTRDVLVRERAIRRELFPPMEVAP